MTTTTNDTPTNEPTTTPDTDSRKQPSAPRAVWNALTRNPGATTAELSLAAGVARSTTAKALAAFQKEDLAVRKPGQRDGIRRTPDRWYPSTPADGDAAAPAPADPDADTTLQNSRDQDRATSATDDQAPAERPVSGPETTTPKPEECDLPDTGSSAGEPATFPTPASSPEPASAPQEAPASTVTNAGAAKRLPPGGLRELVVEHLMAHPQEAFTATAISRVIERSSGAIANALATLAREGIAQQVCQVPRRYQLAPSGPDVA